MGCPLQEAKHSKSPFRLETLVWGQIYLEFAWGGDWGYRGIKLDNANLVVTAPHHPTGRFRLLSVVVMEHAGFIPGFAEWIYGDV